jgi:hypothetical protein
MSQTETLLLFVLGFCAALFLVLLFGRGVFSVLGRWSGWRETRQQPAAIRELQAERDSLRAEKAIMAQKLEASLGDMKMRLAEQMAEVSRNRNRVLDMAQTQKEREATIAHLQTQIDDKSNLITSLQSQIEENVKSINLAYAKMAQRDDDHVKMQVVLKDGQSTLMMRDEKIRNLVEETRALRDIVGTKAGNPLQQVGFDEPAPITTPNSFEARFANIAAGNPLSGSAEQSVDADTSSEDVERSVSNVLSLAERVRNLKVGMKKA